MSFERSIRRPTIAATLVALAAATTVVAATPRTLHRLFEIDPQRLPGLEESSGVAPSPDGVHLYVTNASRSYVSVFRRDAAIGTLRFVSAHVETGLEGARGVAVSPDGAHVYVVSSIGDSLFAFARDAGTGSLTLVEREHQGVGGVTGLLNAWAVAVAPDGAHVYVASRFGSAVAVFSRDAVTGEVDFVEAIFDGVAGVSGIGGARAVQVSPDGLHVYVVGEDSDAIAVFARDPVTGALTFVEAEVDGVGGVTGIAGAYDVALSADGAHAYVTGATFAVGRVAIFERDAGTGALTFVDSADGGTIPQAVIVSDDGLHVYVTSFSGPSGAVRTFARDAGTGLLTFVADTFNGTGPIEGMRDPPDLALDPTGSHLYVLGVPGSFTAIDGGLAVFSRDGVTGALTFVQRRVQEMSAIAVAGATAIAVSPDGAHAYVAAWRERAVGVFARDVPSGDLAFLDAAYQGEVDGLWGADAVAVSPDGANLYVAGTGDGSLVVFHRDAGTGLLAFVEVERNGVAGVTGLDGPVPQGLVVSPDGAHVYAAAEDSSSIAVFARDPGTGALTFVAAVVDGVGGVVGLGAPSALTLSPDGANAYAVSPGDDALVVLARNTGTGALTWVETHVDGIGGVDGLDGVDSVAVSPDGAHVYAASFSDGLAVFARDPGTGALTFVEVKRQGEDGVDGLINVRAVVPSVDGTQLHIASSTLDGGANFVRDETTGRLTFVNRDAPLGYFLATSPDGRHVYEIGEDSSFKRRVAVNGNAFAGCDAAPATGCRTLGEDGRGRLALKEGTPARRVMQWTWSGGEPTALADLGVPDDDTDYALCLYDESGPTLLRRALIPGGRRWKGLGSGGFKFRDAAADGRTPEGVKQVVLKATATAKGKLKVKGVGPRLVGMPLPLPVPARVQLQASTGECWEATFSADGVKRNDAARFSGRAD
jgi:6-phosphogluconolactonase (cycloisomerase 2 family)